MRTLVLSPPYTVCSCTMPHHKLWTFVLCQWKEILKNTKEKLETGYFHFLPLKTMLLDILDGWLHSWGPSASFNSKYWHTYNGPFFPATTFWCKLVTFCHFWILKYRYFLIEDTHNFLLYFYLRFSSVQIIWIQKLQQCDSRTHQSQGIHNSAHFHAAPRPKTLAQIE